MDKNFAIFGKPVKHPVWEKTKELITVLILGCVMFLCITNDLRQFSIAHQMPWFYTAVMAIMVPMFIVGFVYVLLMLINVCIYRP